MEIEILGQPWGNDASLCPHLDMEASGEPYSGVNREIFAVRPFAVNDYHGDSGLIGGTSGLRDIIHEQPFRDQEGRYAEFKTIREALEFAKTLDFPRLSIDLEKRMILDLKAEFVAA